MKRIISIIALIAVLAAALCACGGEKPADEGDAIQARITETEAEVKTLADVFSEIKTTYNVTDLVEFSDASYLDRFYGIAAEDVSDFAGGVNSSGVNQEEIVMISAVDEEAAGRVETALNNRLSSKLNETKNYNPEQYAILEKCSVDKDGCYVSMFLSENADSMKADFKKAIG